MNRFNFRIKTASPDGVIGTWNGEVLANNREEAVRIAEENLRIKLGDLGGRAENSTITETTIWPKPRSRGKAAVKK